MLDLSLPQLAIWAVLVLVVVFFVFRAVLRAFSIPYAHMSQTDNEKYFFDPNTNKREKFPSILSASSVYLSVVVPSYMEEKRLPTMLEEAIEYLKNRQKQDSKFTYEIIVVDDGSRDQTSNVALEYSKKYSTNVVRVLTLDMNRGKGGAVRMGVMKSRGKMILFADADAATRFSDFEKLEQSILKNSTSLDKDEIIVCGSRRHLEQDSVAKRTLFRTILMYGFHFLVWFLCVKGIRDTQCGFKLLTRCAALKTFSNLHVQRWAFDVDLLYISEQFGIRVNEVDVNWHEVDGSKITVGSFIEMGKDLFSIRLHYLMGAWKLNPNLRIAD